MTTTTAIIIIIMNIMNIVTIDNSFALRLTRQGCCGSSGISMRCSSAHSPCGSLTLLLYCIIIIGGGGSINILVHWLTSLRSACPSCHRHIQQFNNSIRLTAHFQLLLLLRLAARFVAVSAVDVNWLHHPHRIHQFTSTTATQQQPIHIHHNYGTSPCGSLGIGSCGGGCVEANEVTNGTNNNITEILKYV